MIISPLDAVPAKRGGVPVLLILGLLLLAGLGAYVFKTDAWQPVVYGDAEPPTVKLENMEPALRALIEKRLAGVAEEPYSAAAWGDLGLAFDVHDMPNQGIECYERAGELDKKDFLWPYFLGIVTEFGDRAASLAHFERAAKLKTDHAPLHYFIGNAHLHAEDLEASRAAYERAVAVDPGMIPAHLGLGKVALAAGEASTALEHLLAAEELRPKSDEVHRLLAESYRQLGDEQNAEYQDGLNRDRLSLEPVTDDIRGQAMWRERVTIRYRRERAELFLAEGHPSEACKEVEQAARDNPDSAEAFLALGHIYLRTGRSEEAERAYERLIELEPDRAEGHFNLGNAHAMHNHLVEAEASLRRALELDPKYHMAKNNLGGILIRQNQPEQGLKLLRESCEAMPNNADAHFNLGMANKVLGRNEGAVEAFITTLDIDVLHARARFELAMIFVQQGDVEGALTEFQTLTEIAPHLSTAYTNLYNGLTQLGRHDEALAALQRGRLNLPNDPGILGKVVWILATSADPARRNGAEAKTLADQLILLTQGQDAEALQIASAAYAEAGDFQTASLNITRAMRALEEMKLTATLSPSRRKELLAGMQAQLDLYHAQKPFHQAPLDGGSAHSPANGEQGN